jgi:alkanesulfonate monooxygenase SsuD/methylene tetrahydromethanopterin reductase-like flavin-dependent oxidoreductase (luciferase family)
MRFAIAYGFTAPPGSGVTWTDMARDWITNAPEIEALGYDSLQTIEHHFQPDGHQPSPLMVLAAAAAVTERIELATNILLVPLYNPVKLAEDVAVLDQLSNGRVGLGVAPGYVTEEFQGLMVPYAERFKRFEEALDILQLAWTQETFSYEGTYYRVPETRLSPRPVQQDPHPPIRYGVSGPKLLRRAALRRCVLTASPRHTEDELREHFAAYEAHGAEIGYEAPERPIMRGVFVAETREKAVEIAGPAATHVFRELYGKHSARGERALTNDRGELVADSATVDFETFKGRYIVGTPDDAIEQIARLRDELGMTELSCWMHLPGITGEDALASARLFAREVMPAFADQHADARRTPA